MTNNNVILVLAGNLQEFQEYVKQQSDVRLKYFEWPRRAGCLASGLIAIGTFWERKDAKDLHHKALCRQRIPLKDNE